ILIDEARTPLIISAPAEEAGEKYQKFARLIPTLKEGGDYNIDEKMRAATLTDEGIKKMEELL
ncbi:SecA cross-linking domain protein, partial [Candidatus Kuenenbacteria bacterium CG23_combo_of_CG06-09_8_20_14_all_39_39]